MNAKLALASVTAGLAMIFLGAPIASAEEPGTFDITPDVVLPGDTVDITITCGDPDFTIPEGVESGALESTELTGEKGEDGVWRVTGEATVREDVVPGQWSALVPCGPDGNVLVAEFEVAAPEVPHASIFVDAKVIKPGQTVTVAAVCQDPDFAGSKVVSPVLTAPDLSRADGEPVDNEIFVEGKIASDAKPGVHPISFTCAGREVSGEFAVVAKNVPAPPQVPVKPKGAADTGSLDPADSNTGAVALTLGGLAVFAGAGGLLAYRRRHQA